MFHLSWIIKNLKTGSGGGGGSQYTRGRAEGFDVLFAQARLHCDKHRQIDLNHHYNMIVSISPREGLYSPLKMWMLCSSGSRSVSASDLTIHGTSRLGPIMTWIGWFRYITKPNFASAVPKQTVRCRKKLCLVFWATYITMHLRRYNDSVSPDLHKIWRQLCVNGK